MFAPPSSKQRFAAVVMGLCCSLLVEANPAKGQIDEGRDSEKSGQSGPSGRSPAPTTVRKRTLEQAGKSPIMPIGQAGKSKNSTATSEEVLIDEEPSQGIVVPPKPAPQPSPKLPPKLPPKSPPKLPPAPPGPQKGPASGASTSGDDSDDPDVRLEEYPGSRIVIPLGKSQPKSPPKLPAVVTSASPQPQKGPGAPPGGRIENSSTWFVGYNPKLRRFSISRNSRTQNGVAALNMGGFSVIVLGPVSYSEALRYVADP
jgi:hypothetical protein